ncbi:MAG: uracil phosphoribosyltransferase [Mycoplasmoidaceae bacterium]|nr:uracil phosphoribosyltransferase [Mycoplasmoidaceae bacterium]
MKLQIVKNSIIDHQLTLMRDKNANSQLFRSCLKTISYFLAGEATKDLPTRKVNVVTPICPTTGTKLATKVVLVPILRAGLGMVDSFRDMIPTARIGHIGLYRDEKTHKPVKYYCKMPSQIKGGTVILIDLMFATGHSAADAVDMIKKFKPKKIIFVSLVAAPEGVKYFQKKHPNVRILTAALDKKLNANKYIVPGLGDAGDRIFGTK